MDTLRSLLAIHSCSAQEADYLSHRKFSLVNGMHTTLAFMTLDELYVADDGGREYVLLKYTQMPRQQQRMCEAWRSARCARQHGQSAAAPLGSAPARLLCLLRARVVAPCSLALPVWAPATGRPATASGARASRLQSRPFHCL